MPTRRPAAARAAGIRWDRIGRVALLCVLALVVYLYVGPTSNWISTWRESKQRHEALAQLKAENARLKARRDELRKAGTLEAEARRLGMVRAGEKAFVIQGLPGG
jgi:cell division protein FtsB